MSIPGVVAEDAVGLGDDVPAFDIGEGGVVRPAASDVLGIELGLETLHLCFGERHHFVLTARVGCGLPSCAPGDLGAAFQIGEQRLTVELGWLWHPIGLRDQPLRHYDEGGMPARADAVKSGCSSFFSPTSHMVSSASCRFLAPRSSSRAKALAHVLNTCAQAHLEGFVD